MCWIAVGSSYSGIDSLLLDPKYVACGKSVMSCHSFGVGMSWYHVPVCVCVCVTALTGLDRERAP